MTTIAVVTVTRNRPRELQRAAESVAHQRVDVDAEVVHIILGDECPALDRAAAPLLRLGARTVNIPRRTEHATISSRLGHLRNLGVELACADWFAFLDDDNEYEPKHLASLLAAATAESADAAHSHRVLIESDGTSWTQDRFPWPCPGMDHERAIAWLASHRVIEPGSPIMRDRATLGDRPGTVDTSEWLIRREVVQRIPWPEDVTIEQERAGIAEDGLWLRRLLRAGVRIACSERATLRFHLGGRFDRDAAATEANRDSGPNPERNHATS